MLYPPKEGCSASTLGRLIHDRHGWAIARHLVADRIGHPPATAVTGLVVPDEIDTQAQLLFERYGGFGRGFERWVYRAAARESVVKRYGGTGRFGTGANMAFRRRFLMETGLFDPLLDVGTRAS